MTTFKKASKISGSVLMTAILIVAGFAVVFPNKKASAGTPSQSVTPTDGTQSKEQGLTEQNQRRLDTVQPAPSLNTSLERDNLIKRLKFLNNANQLGYVYLLGFNGQVVATYTIKGKVSSLNSMLTTTEQLRCASPNSGNDKGCVSVTSPDLDGSYGNNPSGIFFFTTSGAYVEWSGSYMYSSQPLNIQTPVSLTEEVKN